MPNLFSPPKKNTDNSPMNINAVSHRRLLERAMPLSSIPDVDVVDGAGSSPSSRKTENRITINGTINIIGDSLSDAGKEHGKYNQKSSGPITFKTIFTLLSPKSPNKVFTNGFVWSYALAERMKFEMEKLHNTNPLYKTARDSLGYAVDRDVAQGGATAHNYKNASNLRKGLVKGFVLGNLARLSDTQKQSRTLKQKINIKPDDLNIIFAGANDFVTVGYLGEAAVLRAIEAVQKTIVHLSTSQEDTGRLNFSKNILLFTLPDISTTPRFSKKSEAERRKASETCQSFNAHLKVLADSYRYVNFDLCTIYQLEELTNKEAFLQKYNVRQGILFVGKGSAREVLFVDNGKFILDSQGAVRVVQTTLSQKQQNMLGTEQGKVNQSSDVAFQEWIHQLAGQAKLNADIKIFDAAAVFAEVIEHPEKYSVTNGCAIYYCDSHTNPESIKNIKGNAIVINQTQASSANVKIYFVKDGKQVRSEDRSRHIELTLSEDAQKELEKKSKEPRKSKKGLVCLTTPNEQHNGWSIQLIQNAVAAYKTSFAEEIKLIDSNSVFWDGLHPIGKIHFLLEELLATCLKEHYDLQPARQWKDDMDISRPEARAFAPGTSVAPGGTSEAPGRLKQGDDTVVQEQKNLPSKSYEIPYIRPRM
ncbi:MAG: SGNH/GDSL hydrolase family protein [Pseudomonadota bacterium]